jgi:endoglucanase
MAQHYRGSRAIYAYDILNEPREDDFVYDPDGGVEWQLLAERAIAAIRQIDPDTPILVEAAHWSNPDGFLTLKPINGKNLIYSPHFYLPHAYTHQRVYQDYATAYTYPGIISGVQWDREQMLKELEPVIAFQRKYNVPIYIGEFSVVRWAPGAERWLDDAISIFEEHGWDWTYHAFREYEGWSVEHGSDKSDTTVKATTPRKELLLKYLGRNVQPTASGNR